MSPRALRVVLPLALLALLGPTACGGGSGDDPAPVAPTVIGFSPTVSPYDFPTGTQAPRFTNEDLTLETDPAYPGRLVVFFDPATTLDPSTFYEGGDPFLGLDAAALRVSRFVPGSGNVQVAVEPVVLADRIVLTLLSPDGTPVFALPAGQFTFRVGSAGRATNGLPVAPAPVYHTFFVGPDGATPAVQAADPAPDAVVPVTTRDVVLTFTEGIDGTSLDATSVHVEHLGALSVTTLPAADGFPRLQVESDGATLPSNGHVVVWRSRDPLPTGGSIRVTVGNGPALGGTALLDLNGLGMETPASFEFRLAP